MLPHVNDTFQHHIYSSKPWLGTVSVFCSLLYIIFYFNHNQFRYFLAISSKEDEYFDMHIEDIETQNIDGNYGTGVTANIGDMAKMERVQGEAEKTHEEDNKASMLKELEELKKASGLFNDRVEGEDTRAGDVIEAKMKQFFNIPDGINEMK